MLASSCHTKGGLLQREDGVVVVCRVLHTRFHAGLRDAASQGIRLVCFRALRDFREAPVALCTLGCHFEVVTHLRLLIHDVSVAHVLCWGSALTDVTALQRVGLAVLCAFFGFAMANSTGALERDAKAGPLQREDREVVPLHLTSGRLCAFLWLAATQRIWLVDVLTDTHRCLAFVSSGTLRRHIEGIHNHRCFVHHIAPTRRIAWRSALSGNTSLQGELITVIFAWDCSNHLTLLLMGLASGRDTEAGEFQRMHCEVIGCHLDFTWLYAFHGFTSRQDVRRLVLGAHFDLGTALIALGTARCHLEVIRLPRSLIHDVSIVLLGLW
mmetsp:Transcript_57497/g.134718  ORF Transcript_57497/g.134718 Transcript_57497/m.134718 type:complete len:326 (-) Transcript_57497:1278-2255(-)